MDRRPRWVGALKDFLALPKKLCQRNLFQVSHLQRATAKRGRLVQDMGLNCALEFVGLSILLASLLSGTQ